MVRLLRALTRHERMQAMALFVALVVTAVLELLGVASILPFMSVAASPETAADNRWVQVLSRWIGTEDTRQLLVWTGLASFIALTVASVAGAVATWLQFKTAWNMAHEIATRLVRNYLARSYRFFLKTTSTKIMTNVLAEVSTLVNNVLVATFELVARALVATLITVLLLLVDWRVSLAALVVIGGAYLLIYGLRRRYVRVLGDRRLAANMDRFHALEELLSGIKTARVEGAIQPLYRKFARASRKLSNVQPRIHAVAALPRYAIEAMAFGGVILLTVLLLSAGRDMTSVLPLLAVFAVAGYKLLPALQRCFVAATRVRHAYPVVESVLGDLTGPAPQPVPVDRSTALALRQGIVFENVSFRYEPDEPPVLTGLNLEITKGSSVALVGTTGSGKTTMVDLLLGLLEPDSGQILVDGARLTADRVSAWRSAVSYIPQDVFLLNAPVSENIAFGIKPGEIEETWLQTCADAARVSEFVSDLPEGMQTVVGQRGVRLSGGQKQRIGLARAFYRRPAVFVLDESTSALDSITERKVMGAFRDLFPSATVVAISHRLSTVRESDAIFLLKGGQVVAQGSYDHLMQTHSEFRELAALSA